MRFSKIAGLLGVAYPMDQVLDVLTRLQFIVDATDEADPLMTITVPAHRSDVHRPQDIIEEVARVIGYETVPSTLISGTVPHVIRTDRLITREAAKDSLASAGVMEIATYSFISADALRRLDAALEGSREEARYSAMPLVRLVNPMGEWEAMRPTLRASLLSAVSDNVKFVSGVAFGEVANIYLPHETHDLPDERLTLAIVLAGQRGARSLGSEPRPYDFFDLKGMIEAILPILALREITFAPDPDPVFQPGRCARVMAGNAYLGVFGEVHPRVAAAFDLSERVLLAELDLEPAIEAVAAHRGVLRALPPTSRFPATENDFAVVVDESVPAADVRAVLAQAVGTLGTDVRLFDVYRGDQIPAGKKSLTFSVTMQAPDRALSDAEVSKVRARVEGALQKRIKASLRV